MHGFLLIYLCGNEESNLVGLFSANVPDIPRNAFLLRSLDHQEVRMKRQANPLLSLSGEHALAQYEQALREHREKICARRKTS